MKKLLSISLFISLCYSQEKIYQSKIDSLNLMLKETEKTVSLLKEKLKLEQKEISKIKREISGFKSSLFAETVGGFEDGFTFKPIKTGYIMYGDKEPDKFDFVKFSTLDELTIFREMIEIRNSKWYKAMYKEKLGWINRQNIAKDEYRIPFFYDLGIDSSEVKFPKTSIKEVDVFIEKITETKRLKKIKTSNSLFKSQMISRIAVIGMTIDEVELALGSPRNKYENTSLYGTRIQMAYGGKHGYKYIFVDDGIVTYIMK